MRPIAVPGRRRIIGESPGSTGNPLRLDLCARVTKEAERKFAAKTLRRQICRLGECRGRRALSEFFNKEGL